MGEPVALPGVLARIEAVAGREAALRVAFEFGGESLHVPRCKRLDVEHRLHRSVGVGAALIAEHCAGETIYVPLARRVLVMHLSEQGLGTEDIARRLRISRQTVRRYRRGL